MGAVMLHGTRPSAEIEKLMAVHRDMQTRKDPVKLVTPHGVFVGVICNEILVGYGPECPKDHCSVYMYFELINVDTAPERSFTWPFKVTVEK